MGSSLGRLAIGFVDAHGREAFDTEQASCFRQRILDLAEERGDYDTVSRLSSPGPAGYGSDNDLKYASEFLGGSVQTIN